MLDNQGIDRTVYSFQLFILDYSVSHIYFWLISPTFYNSPESTI